MADRDPHPLRRTAREEARVWPAALIVLALFLFVSGWADQDTPSRGEGRFWNTEERER